MHHQHGHEVCIVLILILFSFVIVVFCFSGEGTLSSFDIRKHKMVVQSELLDSGLLSLAIVKVFIIYLSAKQKDLHCFCETLTNILLVLPTKLNTQSLTFYSVCR